MARLAKSRPVLFKPLRLKRQIPVRRMIPPKVSPKAISTYDDGMRLRQMASQAIGSASPLTTHEIAPPHRLQKRLFLCSRPQCGHFISPDADVGGVVDVLVLEAPFLFGSGLLLSLLLTRA